MALRACRNREARRARRAQATGVRLGSARTARTWIGVLALGLATGAPLRLAAQEIGTARDTMRQATAPSTPAEGTASAYAVAIRPLLDQALVTNDSVAYDRVVAYVDAGLVRFPNDPVLLHYRGFALFRRASALTAAYGAKGARARPAKALFEAADRDLQKSATAIGWPETLALRSAVTGQLIAFGSAFTAMRLGSRASHQMDEALAAGPDNPRVWMLRGVGDFYRPRLFGGGLDKAEGHLRHAIELFARDAAVPPAPMWGRAEVYGWLGQVLAKQGKRDAARAAYDAGLALEPGNVWIAKFLIPALEQDAR